MSEPVKRRYDSSRRQDQARRTRARVVEAATSLFVERGYAATSIASIAEAAEVAPQTIYATFGTKAAVLGAAIDVALAGDDEPVPVYDRADAQAAMAADTPKAAAEAFARQVTALMERAGHLLAAADAAAQSDPELTPLWVGGHRGRHEDMKRVACSLADRGLLREGFTAKSAADLLWVLASPEAYRSFTVIRGWTSKQYEPWLVDAVGNGLLRP